MISCSCGLTLEDGVRHPALIDCCHALQAALRRQREAAATLSFEVSTRYLDILTKMATEKDPCGELAMEVGRRYIAMGDWSPLWQARHDAERFKDLSRRCLATIRTMLCIPAIGEASPDWVAERFMMLRDLAMQLGVPLPDPAGSESPPR